MKEIETMSPTARSACYSCCLSDLFKKLINSCFVKYWGLPKARQNMTTLISVESKKKRTITQRILSAVPMSVFVVLITIDTIHRSRLTKTTPTTWNIFKFNRLIDKSIFLPVHKRYWRWDCWWNAILIGLDWTGRLKIREKIRLESEPKRPKHESCKRKQNIRDI